MYWLAVVENDPLGRAECKPFSLDRARAASWLPKPCLQARVAPPFPASNLTPSGTHCAAAAAVS